MVTTIFVSPNDTFLSYMNHYLSVYSQEQNSEMVSFSFHGFDAMQHTVKHQNISMVFVDLEAKEHEKTLQQIKSQTRNIFCVGVGRSLEAFNQNRLFEYGMDDYISIPISYKLFGIRFESFLHRIELFCKDKVCENGQVVEEKQALPDEVELFDRDDTEEFEDILKQLQIQILFMGKSEVYDADVYKITTLLGKIQSRFMYLVATFPLAGAIHDLCEVIEHNLEAFKANSYDLSTIALTFIHDLIKWKDLVLVAKEAKADFLNESIIANAKMFASMLDTNQEEASISEDLDAIFDF